MSSVFSYKQLGSPSGMGLVPGTECLAIADFHPMEKSDLPVRNGDILTIVSVTSDINWLVCRNADGVNGTAPANVLKRREAVSIHNMPWFFGKISREQANKLLEPFVTGTYLIRESTNFPGDYTLCVCYSGHVENYRIQVHNNFYSVDETHMFKDLPSLVNYYTKDDGSLCTRLIKPVDKSWDEDISIDVFRLSFSKGGWEIPFDSLHLENKLGQGEFGEVYLAKFHGRKVAVKTLISGSLAARAFLSEASVMTTLSHPNLVHLLGVSFMEKSIYLVTEFCEKGALIDYLRCQGRAAVTFNHLYYFMLGTCQAMVYLESKNLVHRDVAARNVLVCDEYTAKISDFGLAVTADRNTEKGKLPLRWTAPESLSTRHYTTKSDVWSYGVLLWEMMSYGRNPYPHILKKDLLERIQSGYRMEQPEGCPNDVYALMLRCWQINPLDRPSFVHLRHQIETLNLGQT